MKRVHLWEQGLLGKVSSKVLRAAILALAANACLTSDGKPRAEGDEIFERVTERRQSQNTRARRNNPHIYKYYSCGDLAHYCLEKIGCRDETLVNRDSDGGKTPWIAGVNVSRISRHPAFMSAEGWHDPYQPGDILIVYDPTKPNSEHVCILVAIEVLSDGSKRFITYDYGQELENGLACGKRREVPFTVQNDRIYLGNRVLIGWLNVDLVPLSEPAEVPDDFALGIAA